MFSLLATTHDPENRFQKLDEIHRRRLDHWNCHTDSLTFVARPHHYHLALVMINNVTNDSLVDELFYGQLPSNFAGQKLWVYSFSCEIVLFCHSDGCNKVKKAHYWTKEPLSKFEFGGWETVIRTAEAKTRSWFPSMDQGIGPLCSWSSVPAKLSEKVHSTPITVVPCGCR